MVPFVGCNFASSVRRVFERIVLLILLSFGDGFHFHMYRDHRVTKTVELVLRFALGWFDHHRPTDGPRDRRRMKAVIHQTFCHVFDFNACAFPLAQIDDAFVRDQAVLPFEQDWKVRVEPFGDIICV